MTSRSSTAFTLIELLFVVAIISVLAAIAVPNFLEAQTRVKVARVRTDMATVAMGLNRYYADNGAYPPNTPEARRYLEAALQNPVMDSNHTSAPADLEIPWWGAEQHVPDASLMGMGMNLDTSQETDYVEGEFLKSPVLDHNTNQLAFLTTPVSYLGTPLSRDVFANRYPSKPSEGLNSMSVFSYINTAELFLMDSATTTAPGLWGDHLTSSTHFYLESPGPDGLFNIWHPVSGPFTGYDPTNGTASAGDLLYFEGRIPQVYSAPEELRPAHILVRY